MFNLKKYTNFIQLIISAMVCIAVTPAFASKHDGQLTTVLSSPTEFNAVNQKGVILTTPNSSVALDFSIEAAESWDARDKPKNAIENCVNGDAITGFEYIDVTIETVGNSFLSEAAIFFSNSNNGDDGIILAIGVGQETSGTATFNSNGILDITDLGIEDVVSLQDKQFNMQFFEKVDDAIDVIDARYTSGIVKVWGTNLVVSNDCPFVVSGKEDINLSVTYALNSVTNFSIGQELEFSMAITNNGATAANNVTLNTSISNNLSLTALQCSDGSETTDSDELSDFNVADIDSNSVLECSLMASINNTGEITSSVTVNASNDSSGSNNSASVTVSGVSILIPVNNFWALIVLLLSLILIAHVFTQNPNKT